MKNNGHQNNKISFAGKRVVSYISGGVYACLAIFIRRISINNLTKLQFIRVFLVLIALWAGIQPVYANVEQDCQQEARDYAIAPEFMDQYVSDCIASRGGYLLEEVMPAEDVELPILQNEEALVEESTH